MHIKLKLNDAAASVCRTQTMHYCYKRSPFVIYVMSSKIFLVLVLFQMSQVVTQKSKSGLEPGLCKILLISTADIEVQRIALWWNTFDIILEMLIIQYRGAVVSVWLQNRRFTRLKRIINSPHIHWNGEKRVICINVSRNTMRLYYI